MSPFLAFLRIPVLLSFRFYVSCILYLSFRTTHRLPWPPVGSLFTFLSVSPLAPLLPELKYHLPNGLPPLCIGLDDDEDEKDAGDDDDDDDDFAKRRRRFAGVLDSNRADI